MIKLISNFTAIDNDIPAFLSQGTVKLQLELSTIGGVSFCLSGSSFEKFIKAASPTHAHDVFSLLQSHRENSAKRRAVGAWLELKNMWFGDEIFGPTTLRPLSFFLKQDCITLETFKEMTASVGVVCHRCMTSDDDYHYAIGMLRLYQNIVNVIIDDYIEDSKKFLERNVINNISRDGMHIPFVAGDIHVFGRDYQKVLDSVEQGIPACINALPDNFINDKTSAFIDKLLAWDRNDITEANEIYTCLDKIDSIL